MNTNKLLFYLAAWKRPEITEICFMGLNRLKKVPGYDINVLAVISEVEMIPLCEKYDVNWVMHENLPLGKKKNFGLTKALEFDWEYLIELGSDDLLKDKFLSIYHPFFGKYHVLGLSNLIFINSETLECRKYIARASFGLGRAIHRKVVETLGTLWCDSISVGMDRNSTYRMAKGGFMQKIVSPECPVAIDIKSEVNIWKFNYFWGVKYDLDAALEGLSEAEIDAIKMLYVKEEA